MVRKNDNNKNSKSMVSFMYMSFQILSEIYRWSSAKNVVTFNKLFSRGI